MKFKILNYEYHNTGTGYTCEVWKVKKKLPLIPVYYTPDIKIYKRDYEYNRYFFGFSSKENAIEAINNNYKKPKAQMLKKRLGKSYYEVS